MTALSLFILASARKASKPPAPGATGASDLLPTGSAFLAVPGETNWQSEQDLKTSIQVGADLSDDRSCVLG